MKRVFSVLVMVLTMFIAVNTYAQDKVPAKAAEPEKKVQILTPPPPPGPPKVFCEVCQKEGKKSKVFVGPYSCTTLQCGSGSYTEEGTFMEPAACNVCRIVMNCSNGHQWIKQQNAN